MMDADRHRRVRSCFVVSAFTPALASPLSTGVPCGRTAPWRPFSPKLIEPRDSATAQWDGAGRAGRAAGLLQGACFFFRGGRSENYGRRARAGLGKAQARKVGVAGRGRTERRHHEFPQTALENNYGGDGKQNTGGQWCGREQSRDVDVRWCSIPWLVENRGLCHEKKRLIL